MLEDVKNNPLKSIQKAVHLRPGFSCSQTRYFLHIRYKIIVLGTKLTFLGLWSCFGLSMYVLGRMLRIVIPSLDMGN